MMLKKNLIITLLLIVGLSLLQFSCTQKNTEKKSDIENKFNEQLSKKIDLVDSLKAYNYEFGFIGKPKMHKKKIAVYIDATCSSCVFQLSQWKLFIEKNAFKDVSFLFYVRTLNLRGLKLILQELSFQYPVLIDFKNTYQLTNKISDDKMFQTFLLDDNNSVVLVGDPTLNSRVEQLYAKTINSKTN